MSIAMVLRTLFGGTEIEVAAEHNRRETERVLSAIRLAGAATDPVGIARVTGRAVDAVRSSRDG